MAVTLASLVVRYSTGRKRVPECNVEQGEASVRVTEDGKHQEMSVSND